MKKVIDVSLDGLPVEGSLIESDYQQLIEILNDGKIAAKSSADRQMQDMLDYYVMWAHQIKTPIAAMRLLLQTDENIESEELDEQLFRIEQYAEMVLHYLRTQSMCSDLLLKKYPLDAIVKQAVRKYRKQFIRKKIILNLSHLDCLILTDEKWLGFVIEQILSNSLKYTVMGSVSIYMDEFLPKTLVIEDTGIGISPEDLPRIFEKGITGYNGRENKKSTGIGLYLCKRILEKLSHTIMVTSAIDKGTIVKIGLDSVEMISE
ncbi:Adaptive-response sensory-kinase SasA [bioreactor metagenome]|uniref:histidine kinase n=1 Tax=bioreactor metagenome TaxID=1076179 RepID=A0A645AXA2_9ZZZZ